MPPALSFGRLCINAVYLARESAHKAGVKFNLSDAAKIIDQLDEGRIQPAQPRKITRDEQTELFNALALACGINPMEVTRGVRQSIAVALADIRSVSPNVTPEDFRSRSELFKRKHKDWTLTVPTLAKYWGELGPANGLTAAAKRELPPTGWEEVFRKWNVEECGNDPITTEMQISQGWERLGSHQKAAVQKRIVHA